MPIGPFKPNRAKKRLWRKVFGANKNEEPRVSRRLHDFNMLSKDGHKARDAEDGVLVLADHTITHALETGLHLGILAVVEGITHVPVPELQRI